MPTTMIVTRLPSRLFASNIRSLQLDDRVLETNLAL